MRRLLLALVLASSLVACGGEPELDTATVAFGFDKQALTELGLVSVRITLADSNSVPVDCAAVLENPQDRIPLLSKIAEVKVDLDQFSESFTTELEEIPQGTIAVAVSGYGESSVNQDDTRILAIGCNVATINGGERAIIPIKLFARD